MWHCYSAMTLGHPFVNGLQHRQGLVVSSRVSLGSLMSLSQPGSHEEISLVTNLDLSDTSGVTHCTQSAYLNGTSGSDSFLRRTETASMFQGCCENINQFASSVRTTGQHLPTSLLDRLIFCSQFWLPTPDTHSECSMRGC